MVGRPANVWSHRTWAQIGNRREGLNVRVIRSPSAAATNTAATSGSARPAQRNRARRVRGSNDDDRDHIRLLAARGRSPR